MKSEMRPACRPQPKVIIPESVHIPSADICRTVGNVNIYGISAPEYGVVRISFVFRAGSAWQDVPFCASATLNNLAAGSRNRTSQQIAESLDYYGSYFDVAVDRDWSVVTFVCVSKFFMETMDVARDILIDPVFPEEELRVYCDKSRQSLMISRTKVDFNARELFLKSLYGPSNPYGVSSPAEYYDTLQREDLVRFYRKYYTNSNCFAVMSGDVTQERVSEVESFISRMNGGENVMRHEFPAPVSVSRAVMPFPGSVQSAVRIGRVMFPRNHPDYIGMQVVATVLGGYFGSRLVRNLREEHGYTYGAYAGMVNFDLSGYFAVATEVGARFTEDAVGQTLFEIERLRQQPVPEEELSLVKNIMVGEVMRILDGPFGIADITIENIQNATDNSYISHFMERVKSITPDRVQSLAFSYLAPDRLTTVIVGPDAV